MKIKRIMIALLYFAGLGQSFGQTGKAQHQDSISSVTLDEIVVLPYRTFADFTNKPLGSIDNYLEQSDKVNMIKRGAYAWEPYLNGMASDRSVITIDGMRIYAACTDKMDPVTSYVEIANLSKVNIHSAGAGSSGGATIAGSMDLVQQRGTFGEKAIKGNAFAGFESNNVQKISGAGLNFSNPKFYFDANATFRDAGNYKAGGGDEVLYSQFTKLNLAGNAGYKLSAHRELELSMVYDRATDVGYPALPMDVSLARAFIGSVSYKQHHLRPNIHLWESKIYFNAITHVMDDTKRPVVAIRMDMPGWSETAGFYSKLSGTTGRHHWLMNLSGHQNNALAEMTMFSNNPQEKDMFMLTWPGVETNYLDFYFSDEYSFSGPLTMSADVGIAIHNNKVTDDFGWESLKIFYPEMNKNKTRLLKRAHVSLQYRNAPWLYHLGLSYSERAPGISEGYGFYLFNSFDRFDYIGNPEMKNEKSLALPAALSYAGKKIFVRVSGTYFLISDYIIGMPDTGLSVMTIGASGVKIYEQIRWAQILNLSLDFNYQISQQWHWANKLSYRTGEGETVGHLPLMQPLTIRSDIGFAYKTFDANAAATYNARQNRYNEMFGERPLPSFVVLDLSLSRRFDMGKHVVVLKTGVENLLDKKYTTFSDWNRIPRMGRNIFIHIIWSF